MRVEVEPFANYPLSSQQCAVHVEGWQQRAPVHAVVLEGPSSGVQPEALRVVLDRMIKCHESLRTCYREVLGLRYPVQHVRSFFTSAWKVFDVAVDEETLIQSARSLVNLRDGPVIGAALTTAPDGRLRWAIAAPAYSLDVMALQELASTCLQMCLTKYRDEKGPDEVVQYPDYIAWQNELRTSDLGAEGGSFWQNKAVTAMRPSRLPFDTGSTEWEHQAECFALTAAAEATIATLASRVDLPVETVILVLWAGFMTRVVQTDRVSFEWHCDARSEELHGALGCFVMKLPLTLAVTDEMPTEVMLRTVVEQVRAAASWKECFDAAAYADRLVARGTGRQGVEFAYVRVLQLPDKWMFRRIELDPGDARLQCVCFDEHGGHVLRWQAAAGHVPETVQTWMRQFVTLLESAGRYPEQSWGQLPMLGHVERERVLWRLRADRSQREPDDPHPRSLHGLFETQAQRAPEVVAVVCGEARLTYGELARRADALARRLRSDGVGAEQRVGIHLGRSVNAIVAMLAVLKSGAAYVPLDPAYPARRIDEMIADAGIAIVIGSSQDCGRFPDCKLREVYSDEPIAHTGWTSVEAEVAPQNLAYVIYTSGSTGKPKGVMVNHANAVASTFARFRFYPAIVERFLLLSSPSFDSSVAGIYWTLSQGGTLFIPTEGMHQDSSYIAKLISSEKISHILTLPSFYKHILGSLDEAGDLQYAIVAGEFCNVDVVELHRRKLPRAALVNEYGPTEGTVWSNAFQIETHSTQPLRVPIGRPIDSMYGYVLDERLELCPVGVPGEWYIGGDGVARGYMRQPALTAQRFVADPFASGERLYRTGDLVRLRPDGELEYLGRGDNQIKLRGYRIELNEIEAALRAYEGISEAAVLMHDDQELGQRLVAFFATAEDRNDSADHAMHEALLTHMRQRLPAFMLPTHWVPVTRLPLMPNGKLDRQRLIESIDKRLHSPYIPPTDDTERALAQIWHSVLKVERVGVKDNFFDLGGHSLLATQVTSRIRQMLAIDLPLKDLFETANLGELAAQVRRLIAARGDELAAMEGVMAEEEE